MGPKVSPLAPPDGFPALPPVAGVRFAAARAGIRYRDRDDVMLAEIAPGSALAGVFTRSATRAAPVLDCEAKLRTLTGAARHGFAIVVNAGNANAFTGAAGDGAVKAVCAAAADVTGVPVAHVFTASTGVIGEPLPPEQIEQITGVLAKLRATLSPDGIEAAARAIMTTDTFPKGAMAEVTLAGVPVRIVGFAKGSGMIAPDMATMLAYLFTDAAIDRDVLQVLLSDAIGRSFNAITVDSDTSPSDTVMVAATGQAGHAAITNLNTPDAQAFAVALEGVMHDLALQIVRDGEGATKLIEVRVSGAAHDADAGRVARAIANSPLVKTAIAGEDPNWGRIVMAVGKSGAVADRDRLRIRFGDVLVAERGWVADSYAEEDGAAYMRRDELVITVDLGLGAGTATMWTCDLTHGYITINADYRS
ncbi:MAG: bifunctional glutamate N-acetyltransferase/amino-acid acetyltransferase ArgJ [Rhodobacteraceae bacterium]|nr:bifunctional glutamate N-acetyltransferase/amino-acid acetyltransferase ArgJ [Paracoccaceae bacterium]